MQYGKADDRELTVCSLVTTRASFAVCWLHQRDAQRVSSHKELHICQQEEAAVAMVVLQTQHSSSCKLQCLAG